MRYLKNVAQLKLDTAKCTGCGMCIKVCPHGVFKLEKQKAIIIDRDLCMECGACQMNCRYDALHVRKGVGCAAAVISGRLRGTEPACGCTDDNSCC